MSASNYPVQKRYTKSLLKFCYDHNYQSTYIKCVEDCLKALEAGDGCLAYQAYAEVPLGGNGCFNDWWPPVVFQHEDENYVWSVFEALVSQWSRSVESIK